MHWWLLLLLPGALATPEPTAAPTAAPTPAFTHVVATSSGNEWLLPEWYGEGVSRPNTTISPCSYWDPYGDDIVVRLTALGIVDYLKPRPNATLCWMLGNYQGHLWGQSPDGPWHVLNYIALGDVSTYHFLGGSDFSGTYNLAAYGDPRNNIPIWAHTYPDYTGVLAQKNDTSYPALVGYVMEVSVPPVATAWVDIATTPGNVSMTASVYTNGYNAGGTVVTPCAAWNSAGDALVVRMVMGTFTEYLKPLPGLNLCDLLTLPNASLWSPHPSGPFEALPPAAGSWAGRGVGNLTGTFYFAYGARDTSSGWGSYGPNGGCCYRRFKLNKDWGQGFTLSTLTPMDVTATPSTAPTAQPTAEPTAAPTATPTTAAPTAEPTSAPSAAPTAAPTAVPSAEPTAAPSPEPTAQPTAAPSATPTTAAPSAEPTAQPTATPTTTAPTAVPTTAAPTAVPTAQPTATPTTTAPTATPTTATPTAAPTSAQPTATPTSAQPTAAPTSAPTAVELSEGEDLSTGATVGIVLSLVVVVGGLCFCFWKERGPAQRGLLVPDDTELRQLNEGRGSP